MVFLAIALVIIVIILSVLNRNKDTEITEKELQIMTQSSRISELEQQLSAAESQHIRTLEGRTSAEVLVEEKLAEIFHLKGKITDQTDENTKLLAQLGSQVEENGIVTAENALLNISLLNTETDLNVALGAMRKMKEILSEALSEEKDSSVVHSANLTEEQLASRYA